MNIAKYTKQIKIGVWNQNTEVSTYTWNEATASFERQVVGYDFAAVEHRAERLLFVEQDFPAAIVLLETFLIEAPPEPNGAARCYQGECTYHPDWYHPYLHYLLGFAYEMAERPELAIKSYFRLWQDYPDHIFGQAAADKLILQQP